MASHLSNSTAAVHRSSWLWCDAALPWGRILRMRLTCQDSLSVTWQSSCLLRQILFNGDFVFFYVRVERLP